MLIFEELSMHFYNDLVGALLNKPLFPPIRSNFQMLI